jgi:tetratricopeptide (TPR) repeat protein
MALDPARLYGDVRSLQAEIEAYQNGFATSAENASGWTQIKLLVKRHKAASIGLAAVLIVGGTLGTKALVEGRRAEREALRANRTLSELKETAPTLLALAQTESASQRFDSALTKVEAALLLDPALGPAYWERAWNLLGQQRWGEAAEAVHLAGEHDASSRDVGTLLKAIEQLAAAPSEAERWSSEAARVVFQRLNAAGATGPVFAFASRLKLDTEQRRKLVEEKLRQAWGDNAQAAIFDGFIRVGFGRRPVRSLEPLKGLPIDELTITDTLIDDLEPLRGMRLIKLYAEKTAIKSVEPLRGMPLQELRLAGTNVRDLAPLAGMPLRSLMLPDGKDLDFSVLRGMPLSHIVFGDNDVSDISFLAGIPLVRVTLFKHPRLTDLSPLRNAPLEYLKLESTQVRDLSVLRGMPLHHLLLTRGVVIDLEPLSGLPLERLD